MKQFIIISLNEFKNLLNALKFYVFLCRNRNELAQLIGTLENQIQNNDTKEESESEAGAFTFV